MRNVVKIGLIAFAFLFVSCSDVPDAPDFKFCKRSSGQCLSIYSSDNDGIHTISKDECSKMQGCIVNDCKETCTSSASVSSSSAGGGGGSSSSRSGQGGQ
ncbi:MAG: hypothetical protein FWB90_04470 [Fibromonadales bacterium]|nr:hypothetical protein [Fibromonadales bacterium]